MRSTSVILVAALLLVACGDSLPSQQDAIADLDEMESSITAISFVAFGEHGGEWRREVQPGCGILEGEVTVSVLDFPSALSLADAEAAFSAALAAAGGEMVFVDRFRTDVYFQFDIPQRPGGVTFPLMVWSGDRVSFNTSVCYATAG